MKSLAISPGLLLAISIFMFIACPKVFILNCYAQQTITYQASNERIANPERGFYHYIETRASDLNIYNVATLRSFRQQEDITLLYCINYLDEFVTSPVSATFLDHFETNMNAVRDAGLKCVLRFAYTDNDPTTRNEEPPFGDASKEQILAHIEQLGPLLSKHADVIAVMQAGFIGVWGEWYYTDHFVDNPSTPWVISATQQARRFEIIEALLAYLPESHQVAVRYPHAKQGMLLRTIPITEAEAFQDTPVSRLGFHNDCFLAGEQDFGTYRDEADRLFLAEETNYVGLGGESCQNNPPRSSCDNALQELAQFHWTYLNTDYHPEVISSWRSQGCLPEIENRLGYRLTLLSGTYPTSVETGQLFNFKLELENLGWAAPIKNRPVILVATNTMTGASYDAMLPSQIQTWIAGESIQLDYEICTTSEVQAGTYDLALFLPDTTIVDERQPDYAIRFANESGMWDKSTGLNLLNHSIQINQGNENCTGPIQLAPDQVATSSDNSTEQSSDFAWELYPNPANSIFYLKFNAGLNLTGSVKIEVFDLLGRRVSTQEFATSGLTYAAIEAYHLLPGTYVIRVTNQHRTTSKLATIK